MEFSCTRACLSSIPFIGAATDIYYREYCDFMQQAFVRDLMNRNVEGAEGHFRSLLGNKRIYTIFAIARDGLEVAALIACVSFSILATSTATMFAAVPAVGFYMHWSALEETSEEFRNQLLEIGFPSVFNRARAYLSGY